MNWASRRQRQRVLERRILAFIEANPGTRFGDLWEAMHPVPTRLTGIDIQMALAELKACGLVRYVSRTSVPFDPVAKYPGWWRTALKQEKVA